MHLLGAAQGAVKAVLKAAGKRRDTKIRQHGELWKILCEVLSDGDLEIVGLAVEVICLVLDVVRKDSVNGATLTP